MVTPLFRSALAAAALMILTAVPVLADDWRGVWKSAHTPEDKYAAQSAKITWTETHVVVDLSFDEQRYTSSDVIGRGIFADGAPRMCSLVYAVGKRNRLTALGNECPPGLKLKDPKLKPVKANKKTWMSLQFIVNRKGQAMTAGRVIDGTVSPNGGTPPKREIDIAGVSLGGSVAEAKSAIEGVVGEAHADWKPEFRAIQGLWGANSGDFEIAVRKLFSKVDGLEKPEEYFELWSLTDAPDDRPLLILRQWHPDEGDAPMADQVDKALIKKYGKPSVDRSRAKWWYFDTNGKRVRSCREEKFRDDVRVTPFTPIELRKGCGYVLGTVTTRDNTGRLVACPQF